MPLRAQRRSFTPERKTYSASSFWHAFGFGNGQWGWCGISLSKFLARYHPKPFQTVHTPASHFSHSSQPASQPEDDCDLCVLWLLAVRKRKESKREGGRGNSFPEFPPPPPLKTTPRQQLSLSSACFGASRFSCASCLALFLSFFHSLYMSLVFFLCCNPFLHVLPLTVLRSHCSLLNACMSPSSTFLLSVVDLLGCRERGKERKKERERGMNEGSRVQAKEKSPT